MTALRDVIVDALEELLRVLFSPITSVIEDHAPQLLQTVVGTPHPNAVFSRPTNGSWPGIYDYYWETLIPLTLFLWAVSIGLVIFFEATSHLFSGYHESKLKRRAFTGLLGILSWWWIAAISLRFVHALTGFLVPDLSDIALFETLSFTTMGVLGLVVSLSVDLVLFILLAIVYFTRQVVLYLFVLLMPILIAFWIPGIGPFALASRFMKRLAGFFVPFLFMTVPVALIFRLGQLIGTNFGFSMEGIGAWLIALVIPVLAVVSPFVLFWQAGTLMSVGGQMAAHTSRRRAQTRVDKARDRGSGMRLSGRNFVRGLRDDLAIKRGGQYALGSGGSRAHAVGSRLNSSGARLRRVLRTNPTQPDDGGPSPSGAAESTQAGRIDNFEHLRHRGPPQHRRGAERSVDPAADDRPWYIN